MGFLSRLFSFGKRYPSQPNKSVQLPEESGDTPDIVFISAESYFFRSPGRGMIFLTRPGPSEQTIQKASKELSQQLAQIRAAEKDQKLRAIAFSPINTDGGNTDHWSGPAGNYAKDRPGNHYGTASDPGRSGYGTASDDGGGYDSGWKD